jgi:hypothetical protein
MYKFLNSILAILVACAIHSNTMAQLPKLEFGVTYGLSNFLGDLGGNAGKGGAFLKDNQLSLTKSLKGVYVAYRPSEHLNIQFAINAGRVGAADSLINGRGGIEDARRNRNQHFRSNISEFYLALEFFPTVFLEYDPNEVYHHLHPYFLIGIGAFHFNPQAQYIDESGSSRWVDLKPLRTEGQGMPNYPERKEYSLTNFHMPYGVGLKYFVNRSLAIGLEVVTRKTFTDYVDDVSTNYISKQDFENYFGAGSEEAKIAFQMSNKAAYKNGGNYLLGYGPGAQRGQERNNDAYYSINLRVSFRIGDLKYFGRKQVKSIQCPSTF